MARGPTCLTLSRPDSPDGLTPFECARFSPRPICLAIANVRRILEGFRTAFRDDIDKRHSVTDSRGAPGHTLVQFLDNCGGVSTRSAGGAAAFRAITPCPGAGTCTECGPGAWWHYGFRLPRPPVGLRSTAGGAGEVWRCAPRGPEAPPAAKTWLALSTPMWQVWLHAVSAGT